MQDQFHILYMANQGLIAIGHLSNNVLSEEFDRARIGALTEIGNMTDKDRKLWTNQRLAKQSPKLKEKKDSWENLFKGMFVDDYEAVISNHPNLNVSFLRKIKRS